jgi:hypothetical protein
VLRSYYINMDPAYSDMPAASIGRSLRSDAGHPYQTKLTFLANLLTFLRILLERKLDYDRWQTRPNAYSPSQSAMTCLVCLL